ncbi:trimeric intracellular cation channel family protein [Parashewanella spongiae]|uniref:Trimeric intracellular cation channel family protein n=1 Tax=Parashewanella spongiae TaxID=342950 RepID=A0A3A6T734_9GAMM|nr:trimeric intracellular cation channel family protein [Parashewanella spongiae]MCL1079648.1 trimeric intracellular cation channel family protein [Parashewanella spongiae]RJY07225.1 trimeric intracellular cation channel family protein [Parashewanella spongiae]
MNEWIYFFDLWGTAVFALTGALAAGHHRMDPFGVFVLAGVTAVGGGSIRDALMGTTPVFWLQDQTYILVVLTTVMLTLSFTRTNHSAPWYLLPIADALGLALFTVIGAEKAMGLGLSEVSIVIMGVITGVGGGVLRDILCRQVPMIMRTEIYATSSIVGAIIYCLCLNMEFDSMAAVVVAMTSAFVIRLAAIKWQLSLPAFDLKRA